MAIKKEFLGRGFSFPFRFDAAHGGVDMSGAEDHKMPTGSRREELKQEAHLPATGHPDILLKIPGPHQTGPLALLAIPPLAPAPSAGLVT